MVKSTQNKIQQSSKYPEVVKVSPIKKVGLALAGALVEVRGNEVWKLFDSNDQTVTGKGFGLPFWIRVSIINARVWVGVLAKDVK